MHTKHPAVFADLFMDIVLERQINIENEEVESFAELRLNEFLIDGITTELITQKSVKEDYFYTDAFVQDLTFIAGTLVKVYDGGLLMKFLLKAIHNGVPEIKPIIILKEIVGRLEIIKETNIKLEIKVEI